jgi:hypothetical protein
MPDSACRPRRPDSAEAGATAGPVEDGAPPGLVNRSAGERKGAVTGVPVGTGRVSPRTSAMQHGGRSARIRR